MENEATRQKNSAISILLIIVNAVLACIFYGLFNEDDPDNVGVYLVLSGSITVLLGIYVFSYKGKAYRPAKWLFAISLIISVGFFALLWYAAQLAKAFQH